jgi:transglutaminase-like putative cysteine protease
MRFSVRHETLYRYTVPVRLAPHVLRLNPRADGRVLSASLTVDPTPAARHDSTDRFGNRVTHVSFDGIAYLLRIDSRFDLEIRAAARLRVPGCLGCPGRRTQTTGWRTTALAASTTGYIRSTG